MTSTYAARLKGQSAFEFMFIFGILLSAVVMGAWISGVRTAEISLEQKKLEINDVMMTVSEKINTVWLEGEGFSTNLTLPGLIASTQYELNITKSSVSIKIGDDHYLGRIITNNVSGTLVKGGVSTLTNMGDYIRIS